MPPGKSDVIPTWFDGKLLQETKALMTTDVRSKNFQILMENFFLPTLQDDLKYINDERNVEKIIDGYRSSFVTYDEVVAAKEEGVKRLERAERDEEPVQKWWGNMRKLWDEEVRRRGIRKTELETKTKGELAVQAKEKSKHMSGAMAIMKITEYKKQHPTILKSDVNSLVEENRKRREREREPY